MSFLESPRFPERISYGSSGGPMFDTSILVYPSGFEQNTINWEYVRHEYNVANRVKDQADIEELIAFFMIIRGRGHKFRFKDWNDYKSCSTTATVASSDQTLMTSTGVELSTQLSKTYDLGGSITYTRYITKPISGTVLLEKNGSPLTESTDYTIDYTTGKITWITVPIYGDVIKGGFEFDVPCRFDSDFFSGTLQEYRIGSVNLPIVEVKIEPPDQDIMPPASQENASAVHLHVADNGTITSP